MMPEPAAELSFWALRKAGLQTSRSRRRGFRYFGLRISAVFLGLGGSVGVFLAEKLLGPDVATLAALPLPAYGALALGTPALLELIRPEPPEARAKKKRRWSWLLFGVGAFLLVKWSSQGDETQSRWLLPLVTYLLISLPVFALGRRLWSGAKTAKKQSAPGPSAAPPPPPWQRKLPQRKLPQRNDPSQPSKLSREQALLARSWGLSEAIFWLFAVGVLPAFALQAFVFPNAAKGHEFSLMGLALFFALGVSGLLGVLGAFAERISPRFPRLVAALILFGPFAVSLVVPHFPNLVSAILAANAYIATEATSHFGLI